MSPNSCLNNPTYFLTVNKIIVVIAIAIFVFSCKKARNQNQNTTDVQTLTVQDTCTDPVNIEIRANGAAWCITDFSGDHLIDANTYNLYINDRWGTDRVPSKNISTADMIRLIDTFQCYKKYVKFEFDEDAEDNSSIRPVLVDCYDTEASCYSIPLFKNIIANQQLIGTDVFETTIAKTKSDGKEDVIFKVIDRSETQPSYKYFDVSQLPK